MKLQLLKSSVGIKDVKSTLGQNKNKMYEDIGKFSLPVTFPAQLLTIYACTPSQLTRKD